MKAIRRSAGDCRTPRISRRLQVRLQADRGSSMAGSSHGIAQEPEAASRYVARRRRRVHADRADGRAIEAGQPDEPSLSVIDATTGRVLHARWDDPDRPLPMGSLIKPFSASPTPKATDSRTRRVVCRGSADGCWLPAATAGRFDGRRHCRIVQRLLSPAVAGTSARHVGLDPPAVRHARVGRRRDAGRWWSLGEPEAGAVGDRPRVSGDRHARDTAWCRADCGRHDGVEPHWHRARRGCRRWVTRTRS